MRKTLTAVALAGALTAGGTGIAIAASSPPTPRKDNHGAPAKHRQLAVRAALRGLVTDGTLTQTQADEVAVVLTKPGVFKRDPEPLAGKRHALVHDALDTAAGVLGETLDELRADLVKGKSLADVARDKNVPVALLTAAITRTVVADVDKAVAAGQVPAGKAADVKDHLPAFVTQMVRRHGFGPRPEHGVRLHSGHAAPGVLDFPGSHA